MPGVIRWLASPLPFRMLALLMLGLASVLFESASERYEVSDRDLIENLDFSRAGEHWYASSLGVRLSEQKPRTAILHRDEEQRSLPFVLRYLPKPKDAGHIEVSARIRTTGVPDSKDKWELASLHVEQFDRWRRRLGYWPFRVASVGGDSDWRDVSRTLPVESGAEILRFVAFLGSSTGSMEVADISIRAARETTLSRILAWALKAGWALAIVGCLLPLLRRSQLGWSRAAVLLLGLAIGVGSLIPQPELGQSLWQARQMAKVVFYSALATADGWFAPTPAVTDHAARTSAETPPRRAAPDETEADSRATADGEATSDGDPSAAGERRSDQSDGQDVRSGGPERGGTEPGPSFWEQPMMSPETAHFLGYLALTVLALLAYREESMGRVLLAVGATAFVTECLQSFMATRDSELDDLGANFAGLLLGGAIILAMRFVARRRRGLAVSGADL